MILYYYIDLYPGEKRPEFHESHRCANVFGRPSLDLTAVATHCVYA